MIFGISQQYTGLPDIFSFMFYSGLGLLCALLIKCAYTPGETLCKNIKKPAIFLILAAFLLAFAGSFRKIGPYLGGADAGVYQLMFYEIPTNPGRKNHDPLYYYYTAAIYHFTKNYRIYLIITYTFIASSYLTFIKTYLTIPKDKEKLSFAFAPFVLLIILYLKTFAALRTGFAVAIFLFGLSIFKRNKIIGSLVVLVTLTMSLYTAIPYAAFLIFYLFFDKKIQSLDRRGAAVFFALFIAFGIAAGVAVKNLPVDNYIIADYLAHSGEGFYDYYIAHWPMFIAHFALMAAMIIVWPHLPANNETALIKTMTVYDIVTISANVMINNWRANEYFYTARLIMWCLCGVAALDILPKKLQKLFKILFVLGFIGWMGLRLMHEWYDAQYMPYVFDFGGIYHEPDWDAPRIWQ